MRYNETQIQQGERLAKVRKEAGFRSGRAAALEFEWPESTYRAHESCLAGVACALEPPRFAGGFQFLILKNFALCKKNRYMVC